MIAICKMIEMTLEREMLHSLWQTRKDGCQLAMDIGYPLGINDSDDNKFFDALQGLFDKRWAHWEPLSSEIPNTKKNGSDLFTGRIYRFGSGDTYLKDLAQMCGKVYEATVDRVKQLGQYLTRRKS